MNKLRALLLALALLFTPVVATACGNDDCPRGTYWDGEECEESERDDDD